jgi:predicted nucleotidyltransferase
LRELLASRGIPESVAAVLEEFVRRVRELLGEAEVYLFGSYARGDWLVDSDIDIIVVSDKFRGMELGERYVMVRSLLPTTVSVDLLLYTREEFERARRRSIIVGDAEEYWIKLL